MIAIRTFGNKSHIAIDRCYGFISNYAVAPASRGDGWMLREVVTIDNTASDIWAVSASARRRTRRGCPPGCCADRAIVASPKASRYQRSHPARMARSPGCALGLSTSSPIRRTAMELYARSAWRRPKQSLPWRTSLTIWTGLCSKNGDWYSDEPIHKARSCRLCF